MRRYIREMETARRLATKIETQQSVPDQVSALLGQPSVWDSSNGRNYEWVIPATTVTRMAPAVLGKVKAFGCAVFNVDSSADPYYFVCIRYREEA